MPIRHCHFEAHVHYHSRTRSHSLPNGGSVCPVFVALESERRKYDHYHQPGPLERGALRPRRVSQDLAQFC